MQSGHLRAGNIVCCGVCLERRPGEVIDMPVFFYIDPELVDDFGC